MSSLVDLVSRAELRILAQRSRPDDGPEPLAETSQALADLARWRSHRTELAGLLRSHAVYGPASPHSFYADLIGRENGNEDARRRIDRHHAEVRELARLEGRDITASTLNGLVPPTYLVEELRPAARSASPVLDWLRRPIPPEGMEVIVPRVSTASTGGAAVENSLPTESDPATSPALGSRIATVSVIVDISSQLADRCAPEVDALVTVELVDALNAGLESALLAGGGTPSVTGLLVIAGIGTRTYTSSAPDGPGWATAIGGVLTAASTGGLRPADALIMHPRRWYSMTGTLDSTSLQISPASASDPAGTVARIMGTPVLLSAGIPANLGSGTNEDRIVALCAPGVAVLASTVPDIRIMRANPETVRVSVSAYLAVPVRNAAGIAVLSGTALANTL